MGEVYRFAVGSLQCAVLSDGTGVFPGSAAQMYFATAPREDAERALRALGDSTEQMLNQYNCLLVDSGAYRVLVDTGSGPGVFEGMGRLPESLRAAGFAPDDIDLVIVSHAHPDHIGGLTDGDGKPAFPNARYVMWRDEWDYWTSDDTLAKLNEMPARAIRKNLLPLEERMQLIDSETDIVPGVCPFPTPGHAPGHLALRLSSEGQHFLYAADALLHPLHAEHPDWSSAFDASHEQAAHSRRRLCVRAVADDALVLAYHFPFPGLGRIVERDDVWRWQPLEPDGT